jgi:hypothetical protein
MSTVTLRVVYTRGTNISQARELSLLHIKVTNDTDHDISLHGRTVLGRLQLVRSVTPLEVKSL